MSEPFWEPLAAAPAAGVPQPVVNGQWIKGVGGAAVWAPLAIVDADVAAGAAIAPTKVASSLGLASTGADVHFLRGDSGVITLNNAIEFTSNTPYQGIFWLSTGPSYGSIYRDNATGRFYIGSQVGPVSGAIYGNANMGFQRHPYGGDRHMESGRATVGAGLVLTVAFTAAFISAPSVTLMSEAVAGAYCALEGPPATTQCRIWNTHPSSTLVIDWIAEGPN